MAVRVGELHADRSRPQRLVYDGTDIVHGLCRLRAALTGFDVDGLADAQEGQVFLISCQQDPHRAEVGDDEGFGIVLEYFALGYVLVDDGPGKRGSYFVVDKAVVVVKGQLFEIGGRKAQRYELLFGYAQFNACFGQLGFGLEKDSLRRDGLVPQCFFSVKGCLGEC